MAKKETGYEQNIKNTGAQEVAAMKKTTAGRKGTAVRGKDLRSGK